jgi:hypothetical protein
MIESIEIQKKPALKNPSQGIVSASTPEELDALILSVKAAQQKFSSYSQE